ncbi:type II toxin-antitoxin system PemK/MazF family toxin [Salegentibacter maritimus]|uniref:Type II toxin-antitoxin system PemK/MazF family toxin n=1 Tax=Salegentibacter maritimus TaxID=2794347 RepID=A0ABS0TJ52_9FLAO|nr:type II toxin-antitoxin system PemK/MazF family toxin [Salegentibacter maritimus]MBI6121058.1 type II toxin-antitoxin system PemK/MazF family toxin [Salegentibacter maritimus]
MELKQYSIILVNLDLIIGSEIKKNRPCVIISPDEMNKYLRTIVVAPLTTNLKKYPPMITIKINNKKGMVAIDQIRTIDKQRIVKVLDSLTKLEIRKCKEAV